VVVEGVIVVVVVVSGEGRSEPPFMSHTNHSAILSCSSWHTLSLCGDGCVPPLHHTNHTRVSYACTGPRHALRAESVPREQGEQHVLRILHLLKKLKELLSCRHKSRVVAIRRRAHALDA
jgi:hypothetical protein